MVFSSFRNKHILQTPHFNLPYFGVPELTTVLPTLYRADRADYYTIFSAN